MLHVGPRLELNSAFLVPGAGTPEAALPQSHSGSRGASDVPVPLDTARYVVSGFLLGAAKGLLMVACEDAEVLYIGAHGSTCLTVRRTPVCERMDKYLDHFSSPKVRITTKTKKTGYICKT